jgi:hypothetical protein
MKKEGEISNKGQARVQRQLQERGWGGAKGGGRERGTHTHTHTEERGGGQREWGGGGKGRRGRYSVQSLESNNEPDDQESKNLGSMNCCLSPPDSKTVQSAKESQAFLIVFLVSHV